MTVLPLLLVLQVYFDGVPVPCLVDTGATMTVLSATQAERIGSRSGPFAKVRAQTVSGQPLWGDVWRIPNVGTDSIGWSHALPLVVPAKSMTHDCVLGTDLLGQQPIVIDWVRREVRAA